MRRLFYGLIMVTLLAMSVPALAQTDRPDTYTPIAYGDTVSGEITDDTPVIAYIFEGEAGDVIDITMDADDDAFDTRLFVFTQAGYESGEIAIAEDDDGGDGFNSFLEGYVLPTTGAYIIEATRFSGEGTYELSLSRSGSGDAVGVTLAYGDSATSQITTDINEQLYNFEGEAGDVVSISMTAADTAELDPDLYLYTLADFANNSAAIANNDDFDGLNSRIDQFELPEDGIYVIRATRFAGTGDFTLVLEGEGMSMGGAQEVVLDDGASVVSIMVPASWETTFDAPFTVLAESADSLEVFTADAIVPAPEGEIALAIAAPEGAEQGLREITGSDVEATTEAYLEAALGLFGVSADLIQPYEGFAVPASFAVFPEDADAPPNTVMFMVELDEGIAWVISVTGGDPMDFEADVVEIVNTMAGIEPSFASEMEDDMGDAGTGTVDIGDGLTISIPDGWQTMSEFPLVFVGSSEEALTVFTSDDIVNAPDGEIVIAFAGPSALAQIAGDVSEQTTAAYQELIATSLFEAPDPVEAYDGFDFPASGVILDNAPESPDNSTSFVVDVDGQFVWVIVVTGGEPAQFEDQIVEIVNSLGE